MNPHARHWVDGAWSDGASGTACETRNPADGSVVATYADGGADEALASIAAARRVEDGSSWARDARTRARALLEMADALEGRAASIAAIFTAENGKPLRESQAEIAASASELRFYAGLARTNFGRMLETEPSQISAILREPMGVAGIIVPWNAPIILLIRSLAPALAAGCTAAIKCAPQTALTSARVFEAFAECHTLPQGAVNAFFESGADGVRALVQSTDVDVVSYTGSTHVGKSIVQLGAGTLKKMNLELGGSAPCLVFEDADLVRAVPALVKASMIMAGQQCVAASRLIVHRSIVHELVARLRSALQAMKVGRGDDPNTELGPMIDCRSRERVERLIESAAARTQVHLCGARPGGTLAAGAFLTPSLIAVADPKDPLLREEIFGPVLTVQTFESEREAIVRANDSRFGLAASVWTRDLQRAQRVGTAIKAGTVWLNMHGRLAAEVESGGYRESGIGRLHGAQGLEEFLQVKHVAWELGTAS